MSLKHAAVALFCFIMVTAGLQPPETAPPQQQIPATPPPKRWGVADCQNLITEQDARSWLGYLASPALEGRMSGKRGNRAAAEFIKKKFEGYGYAVQYQKFGIRRMNPGPLNEAGDDFTQNVIAVRGSGREIVIASHLDHVGYGLQMTLDNVQAVHPGADDNASGTTAVLMLANAFRHLPTRHRLTFICFSGEEMGLLGSKHYVEQLGDQVRNIDLMVNFDMVGRLRSNSVDAVGARKSPALTDLLGKMETKYGLQFLPGEDKDNSDHAPFRSKGVPVCFFSTRLHPEYHRVTDTPDKINYDGLVKLTRAALDMIYQFDQR